MLINMRAGLISCPSSGSGKIQEKRYTERGRRTYWHNQGAFVEEEEVRDWTTTGANNGEGPEAGPSDPGGHIHRLPFFPLLPLSPSSLPNAPPLCPSLPPFLSRPLECECFLHRLIRNHKYGYVPKFHPPPSSFLCPFSQKSFLRAHVYFHINGMINSSVPDCSASF